MAPAPVPCTKENARLVIWRHPYQLATVVRLPDPKLKTLGERGIECIFVGYAEHSKAFRFYVIEPNESVSINSIIESKDAIFDENRFSSVPRPSQRSLINGTEDIGGLVVLKEVTEEKEAINDEMDSIMGNNTWVLADLPPGCKPLGCKWIFKRKLKVDGTIEKFKARLVIQGFRQKSGIDYFDTYAPVARISTIRLLIAMASIHNLIIHQMDVKTAFLNGDLEEEVYMNQPQGFIMPGNENKVCKLIKSLYGLKQAPKQWHQKFDEVVLSNGYLLNQADKCVYRKFDETGKGVIICLYVDDMLIFGTDQVQVDLTKEFLSSRFSMKDMGEADVILVLLVILYSALAPAPRQARLSCAATLAKAYIQMYNRKSRHLYVRHSMIRELIMNGVIYIEFVRSQQNLADHLTKGLAIDLVINSAEGMGLNRLKHMYLHIIPKMCLEPAEKEDEVWISQKSQENSQKSQENSQKSSKHGHENQKNTKRSQRIKAEARNVKPQLEFKCKLADSALSIHDFFSERAQSLSRLREHNAVVYPLSRQLPHCTHCDRLVNSIDTESSIASPLRRCGCSYAYNMRSEVVVFEGCKRPPCIRDYCKARLMRNVDGLFSAVVYLREEISSTYKDALSCLMRIKLCDSPLYAPSSMLYPSGAATSP
ncbi:zinc finger, CCHC-type containing protein [Tanacetum coccineum]